MSTGNGKGLVVEVFRPASGSDCTLGGLSSRHASLTITALLIEGPVDRHQYRLERVAGPFEPTTDKPEAWLYWQPVVGGVWCVIPALAELPDGVLERWAALRVHASPWMFGGNFVEGGAKLKELTGHRMIAVHDRNERQ